MGFAIQFPGQGSQAVGMLTELAERFPVVRASFDEAGDALDYNLWQLVSDGPAEELDRTEQTQPALLAAGIACWRVWREVGGVMPAAVAGHSLGEYSALVAADVLDFQDAVRLVRRRAQLMQGAVPEGKGAMAAIIGMEDQAVQQLCQDITAQADGTLQAVNFNAPGQVVIAGDSALIDQAIEMAPEREARMVKRLPISVPCHSDMLKAAAEELSASLQETAMRPPSIPVIHNIDAQPRTDVEAIRQAMATQLYSPVLWTQCIGRLQSDGITLLLESGPGRVLSGLARRIDRSLHSGSLHEPEAVESALKQVEELQV